MHTTISLRKLLGRSTIVRQIYWRTWLARYLVAMHSRKRSFAQAREDLKVEELIGEVRWFVDIGANDGITGSNTFYFALKGAHGICFEPVTETYTKLRWLYLLNRRVCTARCGISDQNRTAQIVAADFLSFLPETEDHEHISEGTAAVDRDNKEEVVLRRFEDAVESLGIPARCDLLSVDVEGHELNVLKSIPFDRYSFRAVVVETHLFDPRSDIYKWRHRDFTAIEQLLAEHGYHLAHRSWLNSIYLRSSGANTGQGTSL
jgi:FkbM family methyltransferase